MPVSAVRAPGLARRLACFLYEGVLLFGVVMAAGLLYAIVTNQRHALEGAVGLRVYLFFVLGAYFTWFWSRQGQTLAMRTWHLRLTTLNGQNPGWIRAISRYVLAWLWFMPALLTLYFSGLKGTVPTVAALLAGVLGYAAVAFLHPQKQYLHDLACGTRLVDWQAGTAR